MLTVNYIIVGVCSKIEFRSILWLIFHFMVIIKIALLMSFKE